MPGMAMPRAAGQPAAESDSTVAPATPGASNHDMDSMPGMSMAGSGMMSGQLGRYSMMRDGSGTSWQPDSSPMQGYDWSVGGWTGMLHGDVLGVYDHQGGPRGADEAFSESMLMAMGQRPLGPGVLTLHAMLSLDPLMGPSGYPLLLQTGETANGATPLIDRQHPHDLVMELAGAYTVPVTDTASAFLYVGYPGEPALGPTTFMHRISGMDDPAAPITHHWLDSTHVTFGVVTLGLVQGPLKLEASIFNGREPDQYRWDFDRPRLNSYSGRITLNPTRDWSLQVSYGDIHSPEQLEPEINQRRLTASATYNRPLKGGNWQTTLAWGRNWNGAAQPLDGVLLESAVSLGRHTVFGRAETVRKDELFIPPSPLAGRAFQVSEFTLGYVYDLPIATHVALGFGLQGTLDLVPSTIAPAYASDTPTGLMPFLRLKII